MDVFMRLQNMMRNNHRLQLQKITNQLLEGKRENGLPLLDEGEKNKIKNLALTTVNEEKFSQLRDGLESLFKG